MDLRHLRAFVAVAESRSFSKAARKLHVAQPPLSRQIKQLEEEIGVDLFRRTGQGVDLTREGVLLLSQARTVLLEAAGFLTMAGATKTGVMNTVKVGMAWGLWDVINRVRMHLADRDPSLEIDGADLPSSSQYDALRQKQICVGLLRHVFDDPGVQCESLFQERFVVILCDRHPLAKHKSVRLKELADQPLLLHEREWAPGAYDKILALYAAAGITPTIITQPATPGSQAAMLAVASGKGIALALQSAISRSYVPVSGMAVIPLDEPGATLDVQIACRAGETSPTILQFLQAVRDVFPPEEAGPKSRQARRR
jgi:DNA-binding transcriptional LysR family regulator